MGVFPGAARLSPLPAAAKNTQLTASFGTKFKKGGVRTIQSQLPSADTLPHLILTLIALSGEFPSDQLIRLPGGASYKENVIKQLKREKLVRTFYRDGLRGLRLTSAAKRLLLADDPTQFCRYLTGSTDTNRLKSEVARRRRLHRMAEVLVTMYNAESLVFQQEKPSVFSPMPPRSGAVVEWPSYYSARELKDMGQMAVKVRNSRSTGVLLTPGELYAVYNVGPFLEIKWEYRAEMRLKALLQTEVCQRRVPQYHHAAPQGLVFGQSMAQLPLLMEEHRASSQNHFLVDGSYDRFHFLTSNQHGELLLQLLFDPDRRTKLDHILEENLSPRRPGWSMEHDAISGHDTPVLFGYLCDMPRIRRFVTALSFQKRSGILVCFDFQEEALRQVCGRRAKIESLDFQKVKALFDAPAL